MKDKFSSRKWLIAAFGFALAAVLLALRGISLWPDESITYFAVNRSASALFRGFKDFSIAPAQCGMPLYMLIEWLWTHIFGMSELALRSSNLVLLLPYIVYSGLILKKLRLSPWYAGVFMLFSVIVFYINDARPYVLLAAMGMGFYYYAMLGDLNDRRTLNGMHLFCLLGMASHMMFAFAVFAYILRCVDLLRRKALNVKLQFLKLLMWLPAYLLLLAYYYYVFTHAGEVNTAKAEALMGIGEVLYFLTGFGGLGLNRIVLRNKDFSGLTPVHMVLIGLMLVAWIASVICAVLQRKQVKEAADCPSLPLMVLCAVLPLGMFFAANVAAHTLFWHRHCIWMLPHVLVILCLLLDRMFRSGKHAFRAVALLMIVMQLVSTVRTMTDVYYAKDDYKGVVAWFEALDETEPYTILYQGEERLFGYYGWTAANRDGSASSMEDAIGSKLLINHIPVNMIDDAIETYPGIYYLVLNQKDRFDSCGIFNNWEGDTRFSSFKIVRIDSK